MSSSSALSSSETRILQLAKAKIWSEKVRAKNALARAKAEVKSIQYLNKHLTRQASGGRNGPIMRTLKVEEDRLRGEMKGKAKEAKQAQKVFVKEMVKACGEYGVELKVRARSKRSKVKKVQEETEEIREPEKLASPPPMLEIEGSVVEGGAIPATPSTHSTNRSSSSQSVFRDGDQVSVMELGVENNSLKPDMDKPELKVEECGFLRPTLNSVVKSPKNFALQSAFFKDVGNCDAKKKTLTRTKSGRRIKKARELLGPPTFSPHRQPDSISTLSSMLEQEHNMKAKKSKERAKAALVEQTRRRHVEAAKAKKEAVEKAMKREER